FSLCIARLALTLPRVSPCFFFVQSYGHHRALHSFPTRRSSDLDLRVGATGQCDDTFGEVVDPDRIPHVKHQRLSRSADGGRLQRSEEHTSELQSRFDLVCRLLLEKKKRLHTDHQYTPYSRVASS